MKHLDQLGLFEPDAAEAVQALREHAREFERATTQADIWHACLVPGARDVCLQQAQRHFEAWLVFALFLDIEREFA